MPGLSINVLVTLVTCFNIVTGTAVYYITDYCSGTQVGTTTSSDLRLKLSISTDVPPFRNCKVTISTSDSNKQFSARFRTFYSNIPGNLNCVFTSLAIYDGSEIEPSRRLTGPYGICSYPLSKTTYTSTMSSMTFRFTSSAQLPAGEEMFDILLTPYHYGNCTIDEFQCWNNKCVSNDVTCNDFNDCGDDSDESYDVCTDDDDDTPFADFFIFLTFIGGLFGFVIFVSVIFLIISSRRRRYTRMTEGSIIIPPESRNQPAPPPYTHSEKQTSATPPPPYTQSEKQTSATPPPAYGTFP